MRLELTVRGAGCGGLGTDLVVLAPAGTPLAAVLPDLAAAAGLALTGPTRVLLGGQPVEAGALLGAPPLLRGSVLVLADPRLGAAPVAAAARRGGPEVPDGAGVLQVLSGPDAGLRALVPMGRSRLGRGDGSLLPLRDPTASRCHVELDRTPAGTRVRDPGSSNGVLLDGRPLSGEWAALPEGALLRVGAGLLRVAPSGGPAGLPVLPDGRGGLVLDGVPPGGTGDGPAPVPEPVDVVVAREPSPPAPTPVTWVAVLTPALVAVPLALLWSPVALLLAGTGPLVALLTAWGDRRRRRRQHSRDLEDHRAAVRRARARTERALSDERAALELAHPAAGALLDLVRERGPLLWSRPARRSPADRRDGDGRDGDGAPDRLEVRLGTARVPSGVAVVSQADDQDDHDDDSSAGARQRQEHPAGPLVVDLAGLRRVVVRGDGDAARAAARALVCQLVALHSPEHLELRLPEPTGGLAGHRPPAWAWARWLPHAAPLEPRARVPGAPRRPLVSVVDGADGADGPAARIPEGSADLTGPGTTVVVLPGGEGGHPVEAAARAAVLSVEAGGAATWTTAGRTTPLVVDLVGPELAEDLARSLAPLRSSAGAQGDTGTPVPALTALLAASPGTDPLDPLDPLDPAALARRWDSPRGTTAAAVVGVRPDGSPWVLDLDRDGPHALVAGTTGAGKSSLLVAWVLALAVALPPEELSVVLVDYKGGATAGRLDGLPHLVGAVTDLDEHLALRALTSLTAEVRRRERVLADHGVADRAALVHSRSDGARLLPRLLVVVDEVRVLADEVPDLVPGLVRLATVGRSLGVHLVLATQRPAGAVSADARACTNLRVALRVRDAPDSLDVLDDPGAAALPPDRPGAALVRRGGSDLEAVQVASLLRHPPVPVRVLAAGQEPAVPGGAVDEVPLLVAALRTATRRRGPARGAAPWLPPLPDLLPWHHPRDVPVDPHGPDDPNHPDDGEGVPRGSVALPLGLLDEPEVPAQRLLRWGATAPLAVCGGPGSGRTSLLRWLAAASPREVHLVGDPGELAGTASLPQVASTVDPDDGEHLVRVLQHLTDVVRGRPARGSGSVPLLLVDGADRVLAGRAARGLRHEAEAAADLLAGLLAAGAPVVLACDAASLSSRALAGVREVLLLAPADRSAAVLAGVPTASTPVHWPPGRALRLRPGPQREVQLPLLHPPGPGRARTAAAAPAAPAPGDLRGGAEQVPALPDHLPLTALAGGPLQRLPDQLVVGVGGLRAGPVGLDLRAGAGALVVGPAGSGRTSTLHLLAARAVAAGRGCVLVQPRPAGPGAPAPAGRCSVSGVPVVVGTDATAARALLAALADWADGVDGEAREAPGREVPLVLVDDAELLLGSPLEALLLDLTDGEGPACAVVAAGTSGSVPVHRGLAVALRRHRTGLLLHPLAPGDAELLGARAPVVRGGPPGRASLVRTGSLVVVQLARP